MRFAIVLCGAVFLAGPAMAQAPRCVDPAVAMSESFRLGVQAGQVMTQSASSADERLKWVLDHWVPKMPDEHGSDE